MLSEIVKITAIKVHWLWPLPPCDNLLDHFLGRCQILAFAILAATQVVDNDFGTMPGQHQRVGSTHPPAGTRYNRYPPLTQSHQFSPETPPLKYRLSPIINDLSLNLRPATR
jgi:hypothetical protein